MWTFSILVVSAFIFRSVAGFESSVIHTDSGRVEGWERLSRDGRLYIAWTGIPYAEPPVGPLRFKAPKPKAKWNVLLKATGDAPSCLQDGDVMEKWGATESEDCLYLNVYKPKIMRESMPVIVHIHGGSYRVGGMGPRDVADYFMDEDVVLVDIQYRLNAMGFMSLGDAVMPGNFGIKDQVLALKWVKRNIAAFGGNPKSVTLIGESAGGSSAHILLKSPAADDLVNRAVSDSGTINRFWSLLHSSFVRRHTLLVAKKSGCRIRSSQRLLQCLQRVNASVIIANAFASAPGYSLTSFAPVIEPADAEDPVATFDLSKRTTKKPWITSICTGEWIITRKNMNVTSGVRKLLVDFLSTLPISLTRAQKRGAAMILEKLYFNDSSHPIMNQFAKLEADMAFVYPMMSNILLHQGPKWIYIYAYVDTWSQLSLQKQNVTAKVAPHASQVNNYLKRSLGLPLVETRDDYEVSKRIIKYIVNFSNYDDPTPGLTPFKWNRFNGKYMLRITKLGDFYADNKVIREMQNAYDLWSTIVGWENRIFRDT